VSTVAIAEAAEEKSLESQAGIPERGSSSPRMEGIASTIVLALLFAAPALMSVRAACVIDPDIWWHLRTGEWILNHHAVPHSDPFSVPMAGKPWQAYSWLFEVIVTRLFGHFGLAGIVVFTSAMVLAVTVALYMMVRRMQADSSVAILLTFTAAYTIGHLYTPRPWMFTIVLFILEMSILMHTRRTGRIHALLWLPVIFALWANTHIEFIDGLLVLGIALAESIAARWWSAAETKVKPVWMAAALAASALSTLANPYGWRIYSVVFDYSSRLASAGSVLNMVSELQSIPFRDASDFLLLALAMMSVAVLAWQRRFVLFESALLVFAAFASFRSERDVWMMAVVSAAIVSSRLEVSRKPAVAAARYVVPIAFAMASLAIVAGFRILKVNNDRLWTEVARTLPVEAARAVRAHGYAGPIYDDYNWGGYLIWALHMPVSMDPRASLYGDKLINQSYATWTGTRDWNSDPQLQTAGLVIGSDQAALTQLLRSDARYQLVYEDKIAAVFIARKK
jgi:hypothetical protein